MVNHNGIAVIILSLIVQQGVECHLLSSNIDLQLLATETASEMTQILSNQIGHVESPVLRRYLKDYEQILQEVKRDADRYFTNPINEYLLLKRMRDWNLVENSLIDSNHTGPNHYYSDRSSFLSSLPTSDDVGDAAIGLIRLQTTYQLATRDVAEGKLFVSFTGQYSFSRHKMSAGDCWELGRQAYLIGEDKTAVSWMEESLRRFNLETDSDKTVQLVDILKYYAFSSFNQGNNALTLNLTRQLIALLPNGQSELKSNLKSESQLRASTIRRTGHSFNDEEYKALCRGEKLRSPIIESQLSCSYTVPSPFMALQPIKREQIALNPPITVFYDVISDKEIEVLKSIAQPKFEIGSDTDSLTGEKKLSQRRVFLMATLHDADHAVVEKTTRQINDLSGLHPLTSCEILRYGVGGHFIPHWDYTLNETLVGNDNFAATWLLYLNDVESGGATVFTEVKTTIQPVKGSAVFWYNLLPSGQVNPKTRHSGCPVLVGSKWALSKSFGHIRQTFRRPCRLDFDAEF